MDLKTTRSTVDFTQTSIDSLLLPVNKEKQQLLSMIDSTQVNIDPTPLTTNANVNDEIYNKPTTSMLGHDLHDQQSIQRQQNQLPSIQSQLNTIEKFNGHGDPELWLRYIIEKFDLLQISSVERNELIPDILTGEALIWYVKQQDHMSKFTVFMKHFLQYYVKQSESSDGKETVIDSLRNQMLINNFEKLQKFFGKSTQNVSEWLRQIQHMMNMFKLTDEEKLFYVSLCLEADARDWFYDNSHLCSTWSTFIQNLLKTFESSGKADISFNQLRHYEQSINQNVRQYYFDIMKLCKEANPFMDEATKLQYLKDGLKPSLRFEVFLKNPQNTEEFLQYAQKLEELKSYDDKQYISSWSSENKLPISPTINSTIINTDSKQSNRPFISRKSNDNNVNYNTNYNHINSNHMPINTITPQVSHHNNIPKPPYQCYKCGEHDHYIRNCPHFQ